MELPGASPLLRQLAERGVRYTYRSSYSIYPSSLNPEMNGRRTDEHMHTAEVFGRFKLHKRLQLSVYLPVNIIQQNEAGTFSKSAGLGDMMFLLQGMLLDPDKCYKGNSRHQLRVGAGLKLPSGQFKMDQNYMFTTNMQLGSGSLDVLFNAIVEILIKMNEYTHCRANLY